MKNISDAEHIFKIIHHQSPAILRACNIKYFLDLTDDWHASFAIICLPYIQNNVSTDKYKINGIANSRVTIISSPQK